MADHKIYQPLYLHQLIPHNNSPLCIYYPIGCVSLEIPDLHITQLEATFLSLSYN